VLEVSTEGKLENWEKQPMNERISIRKNEVLMESRSGRRPPLEIPTLVVTVELSIKITMPDGELIGFDFQCHE
jgi:hypothetical protein